MLKAILIDDEAHCLDTLGMTLKFILQSHSDTVYFGVVMSFIIRNVSIL